MLIIMVGFPQSGKSTFVDLLAKNLAIEIIRPSDWYPPELSESDAKMDFQIAAWEHALDKTYKTVAHSDNGKIVLLDTCGASPSALRNVIGAAQLHKHKIGVIFIATPANICAGRIDKTIVDKYTDKIIDAVREYKKYDLMVVKHGTIDEWAARAKELSLRLPGNKV